MRRREFERLVDSALDSLPEEFKSRLDNVVIVVEDRPSVGLLKSLGLEKDDLLFGLFDGVPLTEYGRDGMFRVPDRVIIFKEPIESVCTGREQIAEEVRKTVIHEIGHFFGLDEDDLKKY